MQKIIDYAEDYFQLTSPDEQKGVRELHEDFNKQTYNRQTTYHVDSFCMYISEHSNGLAYTIGFKCNKQKQDKRLSNHHFPLHLPQQTKYKFCEPRYAALIWYSINFQWVFGVQLIGGGGRESKKLFVTLNQPWQGFEKKKFTKIEAYAGMSELLVRYLAIEEALQEEIKDTLEHNNQSYGEWCAQTDK